MAELTPSSAPGLLVTLSAWCAALSIANALTPAGALPVAVLPGSSRPAPARALSSQERATVLGYLHEERFQDRSPAAIYATLLDEGVYPCSIRTFYRILESEGQNRERRNQLIHPPYQKPELLATAPNQLWSRDITKLLGPAKWTYFYLYVILDVFSCYVVGWIVGSSGERRVGQTPPPGYLYQAEHRARSIDYPCRPRVLHDV